MTYLRHSARHIHHTVADYLKTQLAVLNWTTPGSVPFNAPVVRVQTNYVLPSERLTARIEPGMMAVTLGNEEAAEPEELGGPLFLVEHPIFVDIFMESDATALALACDVRDIFAGRLPGTARHLAVIDQVTSTSVDGWIIEFTDITRAKPDQNAHWQVVKVTASVSFNEVVY